MDSVLYSARKNKTREPYASPAVKKRQAVLKIVKVEYVQGHTPSLGFSDGTTQLVDFAPFLEQSTNPLIREYLDVNTFKQFQVTNGDLEWNDFDLCFPIIDLYENKLIHSPAKKSPSPSPKRATSRQVQKQRTRQKAAKRTR